MAAIQEYVCDPDILLLRLSLRLSTHTTSLIFPVLLFCVLHKIFFVDISAQILYDTCNSISYVLNYLCYSMFLTLNFLRLYFFSLTGRSYVYFNTIGVFFQLNGKPFSNHATITWFFFISIKLTVSIYVKSSRVYTSIASDTANLSFYLSCDLVAKINLAERSLTLPSLESSKYPAGANTIAATVRPRNLRPAADPRRPWRL